LAYEGVERVSAGRESVEKLVAEAGYSSETQKKCDVRRWKPLLGSAVKTVTENVTLCVIVISKV
jgi:hypothetical protein